MPLCSEPEQNEVEAGPFFGEIASQRFLKSALGGSR
jgi:hypothetical protein